MIVMQREHVVSMGMPDLEFGDIMSPIRLERTTHWIPIASGAAMGVGMVAMVHAFKPEWISEGHLFIGGCVITGLGLLGLLGLLVLLVSPLIRKVLQKKMS